MNKQELQLKANEVRKGIVTASMQPKPDIRADRFPQLIFLLIYILKN